MINFDECTNENKRKHDPNWPYIPDHPYRVLINLRVWKDKYIIKFNK